MGIVCASAQDLYWSKDKLFHVSSIKERFTKTRFENIQRYFHVDNTIENPPRNQPGHDKLIHVPTILEPVCENFKSQYLQWIHERFSSLHKKGGGGVPETNLDGRVVLDLMAWSPWLLWQLLNFSRSVSKVVGESHCCLWNCKGKLKGDALKPWTSQAQKSRQQSNSTEGQPCG